MGWASGQAKWNGKYRNVGYSVAAKCDFPGCKIRIDRGLSYLCGSMHGEGNEGCGGYFCDIHKNDLSKNCRICEREMELAEQEAASEAFLKKLKKKKKTISVTPSKW